MTVIANTAEMLNEIRDGLFTTDHIGVITFVNMPLAKMHGLEGPEEMIGRHFSEFVSPEFRTEVMTKFKKAVEEEPYSEIVEFSSVRKDGGIIFLQLKHGPIVKDGRIVGTAGVIRDVTERKKAEQAMATSEKKFRDLISNMYEVLYTLDRDGRITFVSPSVVSMTQYRDSEIIGHHLGEFIFRDDLPRLYQDFLNFLSGIGTSENEYRMVTKNGEIRWMRTRSSLRYEGEEIIGLQGILSDITERKQVEEALKASEEKYRHLVKYAPAGIYEVDFVNKRLKSVNDVMCQVLGYTEEEFLCLDPLDLLDDDGKRMLLERIMKSLAGEKVDETVEYRIIAKDGRKFWAALNNAFIYEDGRITGALVVAYDITERKRVEEALRESEEKFRSLVETTSDWIWETGADGVYTYASPRVRDLLGYEPAEVLGRMPFEFMPPDESARLKALFSEIVKGHKGCVGLENVNIRRDGRRVVLETSCVPRLDARGNLLGYRGIDRDITDRKRAEEDLQRSYDELELRVLERTAELERINQELQNFTFAASHDLQEPLRKIQTFSDLLAARCFDSVGEQGRDYIRRMRETATRMRAVLQSLMKYSRLTSKAEPFGRVDLNEIAREVVSDLELQIRDTGALVEIGDLPDIEADAGQMRQLFQNLLGNALKFSREGIQPIVRIYADCSPQKNKCEICFNDNGIGFKEEYLEGIFKPFHRLHGKDKYGGVGMGLAICSKVIEHHGGTITAKSTPGKGSTFIVTLPMGREPKR